MHRKKEVANAGFSPSKEDIYTINSAGRQEDEETIEHPHEEEEEEFCPQEDLDP